MDIFNIVQYWDSHISTFFNKDTRDIYIYKYILCICAYASYFIYLLFVIYLFVPIYTLL
jgi:hypothetical protein